MELNAQKREKNGKKVKSLRSEGLVPAVVYGFGIDSTSITINLNEFIKVLKGSGETSLVDLGVNGDVYKVLIKEVQLDPVTDNVIHVGFYKPSLKQKTEVQVPVEIVGEEMNELVKSGEGLILVLLDEITVSALPTDLPDRFEVDVDDLSEIGAGITVGELKYDREKIEIMDAEEDELVVKIDYAQMAEEEEEALTEEEAIAQMEATEESAEEGAAGEEGGESKESDKESDEPASEKSVEASE